VPAKSAAIRIGIPFQRMAAPRGSSCQCCGPIPCLSLARAPSLNYGVCTNRLLQNRRSVSRLTSTSSTPSPVIVSSLLKSAVYGIPLAHRFGHSVA
jgi:hypothetical protein